MSAVGEISTSPKDRKSTRLNSSHSQISYAVFCLKKKHMQLLDVRDALHVATGRRIDRLVAQERDQVAELLELADGDALLRRIAQDARTVAYAIDDAWRSVDRWKGGTPKGRRPIGRDVVAPDGEAGRPRAPGGPRPGPDPAAAAPAPGG